MGLLSTIGAASARSFGLTRLSAAIKDAYFNLTTLLLPGNGTNGAQNNTFLDSSSNNFTITRNGNTTQGTFTPFSQTGWSNFFNGDGGTTANTNQFYFADNAALELGSSDFCIESWVYLTATPTTTVRICDKDATSNTSYLFYINASSNPAFNFSTNGSAVTTLTSTGTVSRNAWNHVAITRSGSTFTFWINGVSSGTSTNAVTLFNGTAVLRIGNAGSNDRAFPGYISNFRLVTGSAVYTTGFTPSTTPLTAITGTQILTCQSNRFIDNSTANAGSGFPITVTGTPSVQAFSPFAPTAAYSTTTVGGSGYFDGTGDYLSCTISSIGTSQFTLEGWIYLTTLTNYQTIFDTRASAVDANGMSLQVTPTGTVEFSSNGSIATSALIKAGTWAHLCVTRGASNAITIYINAVSQATGTNSNNLTKTSVNIGRTFDPFYLNGYISGLKLVIGSAIAPSGIPIAPPSSTGSTLCLNFTNAGITDATAKNDLETVGNAQISTAQSKFGGSSMLFDGTGDYLVSPSVPNLSFGAGDFTMELWIYQNGARVQNFPAVLGNANSFTTNAWGFHVDRSTAGQQGKVTIYIYNVNTTNAVLTSVASISQNTWTYLALVRSGSTLSLYINGSLDTSVNISTTSLDGGVSNFITVGSQGNQTATAFSGYIDDLRITKGYARTISSSPTSAFPLQ